MSGLPSSIQNPPRKRPLPPFVLWVGVLLADWCIMAPVLLIGAMMSSGWVGGSSHPENFWHIVIPSLGVLAILSALALFAWRHVRWFYWVALVLLAIVSWSNVAGLYKGLVHPTEECGIGFVLAVTGLFLCPLSAALLVAIERNQRKCITCNLCVRVCEEKARKGILGLVGRGFTTVVKPEFRDASVTDFCRECRLCLESCPTGALRLV